MRTLVRAAALMLAFVVTAFLCIRVSELQRFEHETLAQLGSGQVYAATNQGGGLVWERELGREKITPTVSTALTIPPGTKHAMIRVTGGEVFVRADGGTVNNGATTSTADAPTMWDGFPWAEGTHLKEENDGPKLSAYRFKCASCTVWVAYSGDRR